MNKSTLLGFFLSALFFIFIVNVNVTSGVFDEACLECLCNISSGCKGGKIKECNEDGVCGVFSITQPYWAAAGKPTLNTEDNPETTEAFQNCAMDLQCSTRTVKLFMKKFEQDCDNNGEINCLDYGALHFFGGYDCSTPKMTKDQAFALRSCELSPEKFVIDIRGSQNNPVSISKQEINNDRLVITID